MADLLEAKTTLTPVDSDKLTGDASAELYTLRNSVEDAMVALQPIIRRAKDNKRLYMGEAGRSAALAMTNLEQALMWAERAYLWESKV